MLEIANTELITPDFYFYKPDVIQLYPAGYPQIFAEFLINLRDEGDLF